MRVWGEDSATLAAAGADVAALAGLEDVLEAGLAGLPRAGSVDAHVHLGTDRDGHRLTVDRLVADLDRWEIAEAICFPADEPGPEGDFRPANRAVAAAAGAARGRVIPFCRVDPLRPDAREVMDEAAAEGARGLKLHPVAQRFRPEAPAVAEVVRHAVAHDWPVVVHAGFGARPLADAIDALLAAAPGARLVLAHGGRGDARALAARLPSWPGVMLDTSLAALADLVALPPERLVFGSDRPYGEHATALALVAAAARIARWDGDAVEGLMGANVRRWLT